MNKQTILDIISKYSLGSSIESVMWEFTEKKLKIRFISDDKSMLGEVELPGIDGGNLKGEKLGIYNTSQFVKLLNVLEDDITISLNKTGDKAVSLKLTDHKSRINYALSDLAIIPTVPPMKYIPENFEVGIKINTEFIDTYIRAKNALPEVETFSVNATDDKCTIILGQTDVNTNTVMLDTDTTKTGQIERIYFSADLFKEILVANKGAEAILDVASEGLATILFKTKEYKALYYLVAKKAQ